MTASYPRTIVDPRVVVIFQDDKVEVHGPMTEAQAQTYSKRVKAAADGSRAVVRRLLD